MLFFRTPPCYPHLLCYERLYALAVRNTYFLPIPPLLFPAIASHRCLLYAPLLRVNPLAHQICRIWPSDASHLFAYWAKNAGLSSSSPNLLRVAKAARTVSLELPQSHDIKNTSGSSVHTTKGKLCSAVTPKGEVPRLACCVVYSLQVGYRDLALDKWTHHPRWRSASRFRPFP